MKNVYYLLFFVLVILSCESSFDPGFGDDPLTPCEGCPTPGGGDTSNNDPIVSFGSVNESASEQYKQGWLFGNNKALSNWKDFVKKYKSMYTRYTPIPKDPNHPYSSVTLYTESILWGEMWMHFIGFDPWYKDREIFIQSKIRAEIEGEWMKGYYDIISSVVSGNMPFTHAPLGGG